LNNGAVVSNIATGLANSGTYTWPIPTTLTPGGNFAIRITRVGSPNVSATSDAFTIAPQTHVFYVNDAAVQAGDFTTAPGSDANSGLDPAHPKASIRA